MKYVDKEACKILYEDRHLLALFKPADWPTQPTLYSHMDLESYAKELLLSQLEEGRNPYVHAVHRLDSPVTGIVLFARTSKALSRLQELIRNRSTRKRYLAYVHQAPPHTHGVLEHTLLHGDHRAHVVAKGYEGGQLSKLEYRVLGRSGPFYLLAIYPHTGRYHQIRVQLASIGCPIVGDTKYGGISWAAPGIALHNNYFQFNHPVGSAPITITALPPAYWPHSESVEYHLKLEKDKEFPEN